ncbi:hypothetical protein BGW42_005612 [Actinomortierella wolfii]|nr:hypothetical protein BGW42_005612 [Actinomortierella wolfii]
MPLPSDEQLITNAKEVLALFRQAFGLQPGFRPGHAKGQLVHGSFVPTAAAGQLSSAPHFNAPSTSVTARFSNSTGLPTIADNDPQSEPRGLAVRFHLGTDEAGRRRHTDIIGHSVPLFPARNGVEFARFLRALGGGDMILDGYLEKNPAAKAFLSYPKPLVQSFATSPYFALIAYKLVAKDGRETYVRYRFVPEAGVHTFSDKKNLPKSPTYLFEELADRLNKKKEVIRFKLVAQIANEGDPTDDITQQWSEQDHALVELGTLTLETLNENNEVDQKYIIFDPIPRVDGIEPSDDPILQFRAALYLMSGRERRAA